MYCTVHTYICTCNTQVRILIRNYCNSIEKQHSIDLHIAQESGHIQATCLFVYDIMAEMADFDGLQTSKVTMARG